MFSILLLLGLIGIGQVFERPVFANAGTMIGLTVTRSTSETNAPQIPLELPELLMNLGNGFNRSTNILTIPSGAGDEVYFFHLNAGAMPQQRVNMNLRGSYNVDIFRNHTMHLGTDTLSRDIIQFVHPGAKMQIEMEYTSQLYSDVYRQTSFTAFSLQQFLSETNTTIFSAGRQDPYISTGEMVYTNQLVDIGGRFGGSRFTAEIAGNYYFTTSIGLLGNDGIRAQIKSSNTGVITEMYRGSNVADGEDILSTSVMTYMEKDEYVYVNYLSGSSYSDAERQTSFGGFYYLLRTGEEQFWSLYRTNAVNATDGDINPLTWDGSRVNSGVYNSVDNLIHISQSGLYYVDFHVGVPAGGTMVADLIHGDNRVECSITRSVGYQNGADILGQARLIELTEGNTLKLVVRDNSKLFSDVDKQTVFTGFMLYPY